MRIIKAQVPVAGVYLPLAGGTMTGAIQMGTNALRTTNRRLYDNGNLNLRDNADTVWSSIILGRVQAQDSLSLLLGTNGSYIRTADSDGWYWMLFARANGVGQVEVVRVQNAADPYFQATLPLRLLPIATVALPATPVEGMVTYDDTRKRLILRNNTAWQSTMDTVALGNLLLASANTEGNSPPVGYTMKKEIVIPCNGSLRIKMDLVSFNAGAGIYGQVYRNGVAVGAEHEETTFGYTTFTDDITGWFAGDLCQLYVRYKTGSYVGSKWKNFRVYASLDLTKYTTNLDT